METANSIVVGATPSTANSSYWSNGSIPWLPSGCCQDCDVLESYPKMKRITEKAYESCSTIMMEPETVLIALTGATAGKVGLLKFKACANQSVVGIKPYLDINVKFLFYQLMARRKEILSDCIGSAQPHISKEYVTKINFALPPLLEQQRIVDRIEQIEPLLQQYDKLEKQLTKLENEITDKLKKSILQYAIEGKLVKQDPNDEPASVLLERIKAEKEKLIKEGKIKRDKNESYIYQGDDKNYYEKLPNNWILTTLSAAGSWKSGSTPDRHNTKFYNGKIPWIKTGELNDNLNLIKAEEYVTELALERYALPINKPGNVLVAMYGATIGKLAINDIPVTTNQACCGCSPYEGIFNKYLFYFIMANKQKLIDLGAGGAQPNISKEKIQKFYFLVPPYREQIRMVRKIELVINILE